MFIDTWHILSSLILLLLSCITSFVSVVTSLWRCQGHIFDIRPASMKILRIYFVPSYNAWMSYPQHIQFVLHASHTISHNYLSARRCTGCSAQSASNFSMFLQHSVQSYISTYGRLQTASSRLAFTLPTLTNATFYILCILSITYLLHVST